MIAGSDLAWFVAEGKKQVFNATKAVILGDTGLATDALYKIECLRSYSDALFSPFEQLFFEFALLNQCARLRREFTHKFLP